MRPLLHHTAASGWVNDPHALVHHEGRYHLFFQYVPGGTTWDAGCHWGHAVSDDLLTWEPAPVALAPDADDDGCWSGNVVLGPDPVAFYTAVTEPGLGIGRVRRAVPDASWSSWTKQEVVAELPPGEDAVEFRDPFVHRDGTGWRMLLGGATSTGDAAVWAFRSSDLETWTYTGRAASRSSSETDGVWTGTGWECPVLVEVSGLQVLLVSVWEPGTLHYLAYAVCSPSGDSLHPGPWRRLSYGPSYYAASTFRDADDRPGLIAWLREVADVDAGWAGAHSLPMAVALDGDRLVAAPHEALLARRTTAPEGVLPEVADLEWAALPGASLDSEGFSLEVGEDVVAITAGDHQAALPWAGEPLRLVVDGPVLEVYGVLGIAAVPVARSGPAPLSFSGAEPVVHGLAGT
jgi:beta-fructofuranosidase